jgi:hypothetical protein
MDIRSRSGVDYIGKYLSSSPRWARAKEWLARNVEEAAIDYTLLSVLSASDVELDVGKDNRSVTTNEWVFEGLSKFGCPIHRSKPGTTESFTVPGLGSCSCGGKERRLREQNERKQSHLYCAAIPSRAKVREVAVSGAGVRDNIRTQRPAYSDNGRPGPSDRCLSLHTRDALSAEGSRYNLSDGTRRWSSESYESAVACTLSSSGCKDRRREPLSVDEVVENHIRRGKYAGAPFFGYNRDHLDAGTQRARRLVAGQSDFDPYLAGRRVQPGSSGPKTRLVWMAPLATTIVGTRFSKPIYKALVRTRPFAWGLRNWDKAAIAAEFKSKNRYVYNLDFSGFDSGIPARMIDDAFGILKTHLELSAEDEDLWKRYVNDFIHSRLITPEGDVYQVHKGVPSGNPFTSLIDSVVNLIVIQYCFIRITGKRVPDNRVMVLGDDAIIASDVRLSLSQLAKAAAELGFTLSVEKSAVVNSYRESVDPYTDEVYFLGHYWVNGIPRRPVKEIAQRQAFPERHKKRTRQESLLRLLSYIADSRESWALFRLVWKAPDIQHAVTEAVRDIGHEVELATYDMPGRLRMLFEVDDGEADEHPMSAGGLALAMLGLVA